MQAVEVVGLEPSDLESLAEVDWDRAAWGKVLSVYVGAASASAQEKRAQPAILGSYEVDASTVRFRPRFPLQPGLTYRAIFDPAQLPGSSGTGPAAEPIVAELSLPEPPPGDPTKIVAVYPTTDVLPENQLRFYFQFSAPMSIGEAYQNIRLLDSAGEEVPLVFLELDEELWDRDGRRFTLLVDPGRIKREVKPRMEMGPALLEGNRYTLEVAADWHDAAGNPLAEPFRKQFLVGPADEEQPNPKKWSVSPPVAGTSEPLQVDFPEPLDHGMLHRVIAVTDPAGQVVDGNIQVEAAETRWLFTPQAGWQEGSYALVVATNLEDLAGNSIALPFEVDMLRPVQRRVHVDTVSVPFEIEPRQ